MIKTACIKNFLNFEKKCIKEVLLEWLGTSASSTTLNNANDLDTSLILSFFKQDLTGHFIGTTTFLHQYIKNKKTIYMLAPFYLVFLA